MKLRLLTPHQPVSQQSIAPDASAELLMKPVMLLKAAEDMMKKVVQMKGEQNYLKKNIAT